MPNYFELRYIDRSRKYQALSSLLEEPWAMLLDSGSIDLCSNSQNAKSYRRFDIFVTKPTLKLEYTSTQLTIKGINQDEARYQYDCPLLAMRELLKQYASETTTESGRHIDQLNTERDLPFSGGWLGYISYDYGIELSNATTNVTPNAKHNDNDYDNQCSTEIPLIQMGLYQSAMIWDHDKKTTRIYNFGLSNQAFNELQASVLETLVQYDENIKEPDAIAASEFKLLKPFQSNITEQQYAESFQAIQKYIFDGDCYQVNFSQQFSTQFKGSSLAIYEQLAKANNAPFSAYLNFDKHKVLSLSPERFIESHQGKVKTQPIKGTRARSTDPIKDQELANELITSEKDRAENLMIVDLLRNDLSKTAAKGSVEVTELFGLYHFESVHHLISTITSTLANEYDAFDILKATLPGGSITGAPKIRAMQIIDQLEPTRRGIYCGIIGYIDFNGNMDTNICIRTLVINGNEITCNAGGGLVSDSDQNLEYQETLDKLNKIIPILENYA